MAGRDSKLEPDRQILGDLARYGFVRFSYGYGRGILECMVLYGWTIFRGKHEMFQQSLPSSHLYGCKTSAARSCILILCVSAPDSSTPSHSCARILATTQYKCNPHGATPTHKIYRKCKRGWGGGARARRPPPLQKTKALTYTLPIQDRSDTKPRAHTTAYPYNTAPVQKRARTKPYPYKTVPVQNRTRTEPYPYKTVPVQNRTRTKPYLYNDVTVQNRTRTKPYKTVPVQNRTRATPYLYKTVSAQNRTRTKPYPYTTARVHNCTRIPSTVPTQNRTCTKPY